MPRPLRPKEPDGPPDEHLPSSRIGHCWWVPVETRTVQFDSVYRDLHHVWCVFVPEAVRRQAYFNDKPHLRNQGFGITLLPQIAAACGTQPGFKIFRLQWLDTGHIARESIDMVCDFKENFKYYRVRAIDNVGWGGSDRGSNIAGSWIDLFDHWKDPGMDTTENCTYEGHYKDRRLIIE
jgi:hypothetical protein